MSTEKVVCLLCMQFVISHHNQDCPKPGFKARYRKYRENLHQYANRDHRRDRPAAWTHYRSMLVSIRHFDVPHCTSHSEIFIIRPRENTHS